MYIRFRYILFEAWYHFVLIPAMYLGSWYYARYCYCRLIEGFIHSGAATVCVVAVWLGLSRLDAILEMLENQVAEIIVQVLFFFGGAILIFVFMYGATKKRATADLGRFSGHADIAQLSVATGQSNPTEPQPPPTLLHRPSKDHTDQLHCLSNKHSDDEVFSI